METDNGSMLEKIDQTLTLARENNKLLKAMRRDAIIGGIVKMVVWIVLIVGSFYLSMKFLEPYLGLLQNAGADSGMNVGDFQKLLETYQQQFGQ